jgi:hypothetical protein
MVWRSMQSEQERRPAQSFQGTLFQEPTFHDLVTQFQKVRAQDKAPQTYKSEDSYIRHAVEWLDRKRIQRPTSADWQEYLLYRQSPECNLAGGKAGRLTALSADSHRAVLSKVYTVCRDFPATGWLPFGNPLSYAVMGARHDRDRDVPRSMVEPLITYPLLQAAMPDVTAKAFISLMRWHGLRVQEALAVPIPGSEVDRSMVRNRRHMLDLSGGTLTIAWQRSRDTVKFSRLKTEFSAATIELLPEPLELIRETLEWQRKQALNPTKQWLQRQGDATANYVFPYFKHHLEQLIGLHREVAPRDFPKRIRGVDGGDAWHVYRHTFATEFVRDGVPTKEIHAQLRHRDMKTTDNYIRRLLAEVRGSNEIRASYERQKARQEQALKERSGQGLTLVKKGDKP